MAATWRTVRVFISSTFRDMHAERDHLVKVAFPSLREKLEPHRIHLVDIDLRWGVTKEQAENDQVLDLCLQQIDECRPFFLGILGERYGWVPTEFPEEARQKFGWIQLQTGKSVTELEIIHGVLANPAMQGNAFFYFRQPQALADVPEATRFDVFAETEPEPIAKLADLKQKIRASGLPLFDGYPARWDSQALDRPTRTKGRLVGLEEFGQRVHDQLWEAIRVKYTLDDVPAATDALTEEADYHERFMESRLRVYIVRKQINDSLLAFAGGNDQVPCLVTGPSGSGKSAALARFVRDLQHEQPQTIIIPHFVGASPRSTNLRDMLWRFCQVLKAHFGFAEDVPEEVARLSVMFREFLSKIPADTRVLMVIDALNQLDEVDRAHQMYWLPEELQSQVKVIVSCIKDSGKTEPVLEAFGRRKHLLVQVNALSDLEQREIIRQVPSLSAKTLDEDQVRLLLSNPATANPLFLLVALEELRGFAPYERLNERITAFPREGDNVTAIFVQVIERLAEEFNPKLVETVLTLLASARRGLSERELQELVADLDGANDLFPVLRQLRPYLLSRAALIDFYHRNLFKAVRELYLRSKEPQRQAHASLAEYFNSQDYWLESLEEQRRRAKTFPPTARPANLRKVDELPWQLLQAADWQKSEQLLTNAAFLEAKVEAGRVFDLNADYAAALNLLPEAQHERDLERQRCEQLRHYGDQLVTYAGAQARGVPLPAPPDTRPAHKLMRQAEARSLDENKQPKLASPSARIQAFGNFVTSHSHLLKRFPDLALQIAFNHASGGLVAEGVGELLDSKSSTWLRRNPRPSAPREVPLCLATLTGHVGAVLAVALTPDGRMAVSASRDRTLRVWDVASGECLKTLTGHADPVLAVALTPDGHMAVSASWDRTLRVWDVASGECRRTLNGHMNEVLAVAITPNGHTAVSASGDRTLRVWDVTHGECLRTLNGHTYEVCAVALTPDGHTAVSASEDATVRVWDIASGECLRTLNGHTGEVCSVAITPDGHTAISASRDRTLRVWDVASGKCLRILNGHTGEVCSVALTPDGDTAFSASFDRTLRVWDVASGECLRTLNGHMNEVLAVTATCDGHLAVSASWDRTIRVWNVARGERLRTVNEHTNKVLAVALTPDGHMAVSASWDRTLGVWDVASGECLRTLNGHTNLVPAVALTPDGHTAVSASLDATLRVWDVASGKSLRTLNGHVNEVLAVALTPDGYTGVSASRDHTLRVWDITSGECRKTLNGHTQGVCAVALTPDGQTAVSAGLDQTLRVWDIASGECVRVLAGHTSWLIAVALAPDGHTAVSANRDKTLRVWDVASGDCLCMLTGHTDWVTAAALTPDRNMAVSTSRDKTLRVWDVATGALLAIYPIESAGRAIAVPVGNRMVVGTDTGQLHFLSLRNWPQ